MASAVSVSVAIQVQGGPQTSYSLVESVASYDVTEVVIPKKTGTPANEVEVLVQPAGPGKVRVLLITSDHYQDLEYKPKEGSTAGTKPIVLDAPQILVGGAVGLLEKAPQILVFANNSSTNDATVRILAGRRA